MKKRLQISKFLVTLAALYFAYHAGQEFTNRLAAADLHRTLTYMEGGILAGATLVCIGAAITIWREL